MKNGQKNPTYPSVPFSCLLEQLMAVVQHKSYKWHLRNHIWSLNLNLWFKPTLFNLLLVALAQITAYQHVMIMNHIVHCIDCVLPCCRCLSPLSRRCTDVEFDDTDEELYYIQKCQASKTPSSFQYNPTLSHLLPFIALGQQRFNCYMLR